MRRGFLFAIILIVLPSGVFAVSYQPLYIVDRPTSGIIPRSTYRLDTEIFSEGGVRFELLFGFFDRINIGLSYSATNVIGSGKPVLSPHPEGEIRLRCINEGYTYPAISIGFSSSGRGAYLEEQERYQYRSVGVYLALSKNFYYPLGNAGIHAGVGYTLERNDSESVSPFLGFDVDLTEFVTVHLEYDPALSDTNNDLTGGYGYLNSSLSFNMAKNFKINIILRDLLNNSNGVIQPDRSLLVTFYYLY
ncbi:hypothetical protein J7K18_05200 [bacterium]|nr:hypothetical protein [bacterium]